MSKRVVSLAVFGMVAVGVAACCVNIASAAQEETALSPNYRFEESVIGGGGLIQSNSSSYQTNGAVLGDTAVGESSSENFTIGAGNKPTNDPTLTFAITDGDVNFPPFSAARTTVADAKFSVINYTSYGYSVRLYGPTPSYEGHSIPAMTNRDTPTFGVEEFGINLVANAATATMNSVGQNISYTAGPFGKNGNYGPDYSHPGEFKYVEGEEIAFGTSSSGQADYTVSFAVNVSGLTPGGAYTTDQTLICTGRF